MCTIGIAFGVITTDGQSLRKKKGGVMGKDSLKTRLLKEYVKVSKKAVRDPRTWKEVATRVRWERLKKILWRRYDCMRSL